MMVKPHQLLWGFFFVLQRRGDLRASPSLPPVRIIFSVLATTGSTKRRKKGKKRKEGKKREGGGKEKE